MAGHPPRRRPPTTPAARSPHRACRPRGQFWAPTVRTTAPTARGRRTPTARPVGGLSGEGQRLTSDAPHNGGRQPPGDALPPPTQRATPARKGARCGAGAGSPRPHRPHLGHTGRGTPATRPRGWAAGGGTASDTRRPSQQWQATPPPGAAPPHPRSTQLPQGMQAKGTVLGPQTHTPAPAACGWRTPTARPVGGQSGEGTAPDTRRPLQRWRATPPGAAPTTPAELGPHRACKPRGQRRAPTPAHPRSQQEWMTDPNSPPRGQTVGGGGERPTADAPHNGHAGRETPAARP